MTFLGKLMGVLVVLCASVVTVPLAVSVWAFKYLVEETNLFDGD